MDFKPQVNFIEVGARIEVRVVYGDGQDIVHKWYPATVLKVHRRANEETSKASVVCGLEYDDGEIEASVVLKEKEYDVEWRHLDDYDESGDDDDYCSEWDEEEEDVECMILNEVKETRRLAASSFQLQFLNAMCNAVLIGTLIAPVVEPYVSPYLKDYLVYFNM